MKLSRHIAWLTLAIICLVRPGLAWTASLETMLMPGAVIQGHAKYEEQCETCHESFSKKEQRRLCLDCHKDIAADVKAGAGYHGRRAANKAVECKTCHTEHKGREADIVLLVPQTFDHAATDFELLGRHRNAPCASCHVQGKKFSQASDSCVSCHRDRDVHSGNLGEQCGQCHNTQGWAHKAKFDHDKTKFSLRNRHREIGCDSCHPDGRYKNTARECISCHRINDVHGGRLGAGCQKCHTDKAWKESGFDHDKETKFPLRNKHQGLQCALCHKAVDGSQKTSSVCKSCHAVDDAHQGRYGKTCNECHSDRGWKDVEFNHTQKSGYALKGKHEKLPCQSCHKGALYEVALERACVTCHANDDVHKKQLGSRCESCHSETGWSKRVTFDHDLAKFPLVGLHATTPCESCHVTSAFHDAPAKCSDCHAGDDVHKGGLGDTCGSCHNPNGWRLWRFDHNRSTKFALDGAHANLACSACHRKGVKLQAGIACSNCHRDDDVHRGEFGQHCDRCHKTNKFADLSLIGSNMLRGNNTTSKGLSK